MTMWMSVWIAFAANIVFAVASAFAGEAWEPYLMKVSTLSGLYMVTVLCVARLMDARGRQ